MFYKNNMDFQSYEDNLIILALIKENNNNVNTNNNTNKHNNKIFSKKLYNSLCKCSLKNKNFVEIPARLHNRIAFMFGVIMSNVYYLDFDFWKFESINKTFFDGFFKSICIILKSNNYADFRIFFDLFRINTKRNTLLLNLKRFNALMKIVFENIITNNINNNIITSEKLLYDIESIDNFIIRYQHIIQLQMKCKNKIQNKKYFNMVNEFILHLTIYLDNT